MQIAFVGLGEAASAFLSGWGRDVAQRVQCYDIKSDDPETAGEITARAEALGVRVSATTAAGVAGADLIFSTVTADQALAAATAAAPYLTPRSLWCDLNSCAPSTKQAAATRVTAVGARYLDVAVMAPVHPARNLVPCLISGPDAAQAAAILANLPMTVREVGSEVGRASSIKMIRSIMVKGLEALTAECSLAAVAAGVDDEVLPSLKNGAPSIDVATRAAYNFERSLTHGARRASEMEEVAKTLADLGLPNNMAIATADWQRRIAASGSSISADEDYRRIAEALLPLIRDT